MVDEVLASNISRRREVRDGIICNPSYCSALMIAWIKREWWSLRFIVFGITFRYVDKEEGKRFKESLFRQDFPIEKLDRIFAVGQWRIRQSRVVPVEVFFATRISSGFYIRRIRGQIEKWMLEDFESVVALSELEHRIIYGLVLFMLEFQRNDWQTI